MVKSVENELGHFWSDCLDPSEAWAGMKVAAEFPEVEIWNISKKSFAIRDGLVYGVLNGGRVATFFESQAVPSKQEWLNATQTPWNERAPKRQYGRRILSNFACIGDAPLKNDTPVVRISFRSKVVEESLILWPVANKRNLIWRTEASRLVPELGMRIRIQRRLINTQDVGAGSRIVISFRNHLTAKAAYSQMLKVRTLLSIICGAAIDVFESTFLFKQGGHYNLCSFSFYNPEARTEPQSRRYLAGLPITRNKDLMRKVVDAWSHQSDQQEIASRIFEECLKSDDVIRPNQLRDLMTCVEMLAPVKTQPLTSSSFNLLKCELVSALDEFREKFPDCAEGLDEINARLNNLNSANARPKLLHAISMINGESLEQFDDVDTFAKDAVRIRNNSTHDPSKLTKDDYKRLHWTLSKLKMIVAINLWIALSASAKEYNIACPLIFEARCFGKSVPEV